YGLVAAFRLLGFPGLELGHFSAASFHFLLVLIEGFLLFRVEQVTQCLVLVGAGLFQFLLHGLFLGFRQLVQVALGDVAMGLHLLAHQFAGLLALFLAPV